LPSPQNRAYPAAIMENILSVAGSCSKYKLPGAPPAGFLGGLWHGLIAPITFFISLFVSGVSVYETHNNGRWYEFGFILGIGGFSGCTADAGVHTACGG
jgi:hypothetical protein